MNLDDHHCQVVSGPGLCLPSDGFIPTGNQVYPGGVNQNVTGVTHSFQLKDTQIINTLVNRTAAALTG